MCDGRWWRAAATHCSVEEEVLNLGDSATLLDLDGHLVELLRPQRFLHRILEGATNGAAFIADKVIRHSKPVHHRVRLLPGDGGGTTGRLASVRVVKYWVCVSMCVSASVSASASVSVPVPVPV
jgi:hypothetical protein